MIMHLLKLSVLPHCFLVQIGAFILLAFNGGQGVKPCKMFPRHSTVLANGLALNSTMGVYTWFQCSCNGQWQGHLQVNLKCCMAYAEI